MNAPINFSQFFHSARIWIVAGRGGYEVADELRRRFDEFGARAQITSFAVQRNRQLDARGSHFVMLLPPSWTGADRPGRAPAALSTLRCAASAPEHSTLVFVQFGDGRLSRAESSSGRGGDAAAYAKSLQRKRRDLKVRVVYLSTAFPPEAAAELVLGQVVGAGHFACAALSPPAAQTAPLVNRIAACTPVVALPSSGETFASRCTRSLVETGSLCRAVARWSWVTLISEMRGFLYSLRYVRRSSSAMTRITAR
jgi:hypothetical protein